MHTGLIRHLIFASSVAHTDELSDPRIAFGRHIIMIASHAVRSLHFAYHFTSGQRLSDE